MHTGMAAVRRPSTLLRAVVVAVVATLFVAVSMVGIASAGSQLTWPSELIPASAVDGARVGDAVDTDGDWVIMGAGFSDVYDTNSGAAYLSARVGDRWSAPSSLVPWDSQWQDFENAYFGHDVAVDGNFAVVGAYGFDVGGNQGNGAVYVYELVDGVWQQDTKFNYSIMPYASYGYRVAIDGDTIAISAPDMNEAAAGRIYVYRRIGSSWVGEGYVTASDGYAGDYFGRSIALSGDTLVGGHAYDGFGDAHVFTRSGSTWTEQAILNHSDPSAGDQFGHSVAIDGGTIAVGIPNRTSQTGEVFVFNGAGASWSSDAVLLAPGGVAGDRFGEDVGVSGDRIIVGAPLYDQLNTDAGLAWVFSGSGSSWVPFPFFDGQIEDANNWGTEQTFDNRHGTSVAIDGEAAVAGAPRDGVDTNVSRPGSVHTRKIEAGADASTYTDRGVSVTFDTITAPGYHELVGNPTARTAFDVTRLVDSSNPDPTGYVITEGTLVDLWSNVSYTGTFTVTIPYYGGNVPNPRNASGPVAEADLKMLHFDGGSWVDITSSVDTVANTVSGRTNSFSEFVIVETGEATSNPYFDWDPAANAGSLDTPHKDYQLTTQKCQVCHAVHYADPDGELLLPTTRADACIYCHITTTLGGIVIYDGNPDNYTIENDYGHQYSGGAGVACADCHSVHGSNTIGGDQGLETKILHAGDYQAELVSEIATGDADIITTGGAPGGQRWSEHEWVERQVQQTAFCTRCHQFYSHTSTQTVNGFRMHPLRDYFRPDNPGYRDDTPDRFGLGVAYADHTTRGCTYFCHEANLPGFGDLVDMGIGVHEGSLPHYTPQHDKFLMADNIPASDSEADEVCFECHFWGWPVRDTGVGVDY